MSLTDDVLQAAPALGFDLAATLPLAAPRTGDAYAAWLSAGYHGEMAYMAGSYDLRLNPQLLAPDARSMIVVLASYARPVLPPTWDDPAHGRVARYAWGADYHAALKKLLFKLDATLAARSGRTAFGKACVDSVPLMERDLAHQARLGFIGRNTCLIAPGLGSLTFIATLLVPETLTFGLAARPGRAVQWPPFIGCGACTRCLEACPTGAFAADRVLDARRCISYLTIEHRGPIPDELRPLMGSWVFGCDVCQSVCPYNRAAPEASLPDLVAPPTRGTLPLTELLALDEHAFRARFRGTPVLRARRSGLVRNACVAAGNSGDPGLIPALLPLLGDGDPLVRSHAAWALGRLGGQTATSSLRRSLAMEMDAAVREEVAAALEDGAP